MPRRRRLYALVLSCVVATALLLVGGRAWAMATAHEADARCGRPPAVATVARHQPASGSWRERTLRLAGCGAWRQVHDRMWHRHHPSSHRGA